MYTLANELITVCVCVYVCVGAVIFECHLQATSGSRGEFSRRWSRCTRGRWASDGLQRWNISSVLNQRILRGKIQALYFAQNSRLVTHIFTFH